MWNSLQKQQKDMTDQLNLDKQHTIVKKKPNILKKKKLPSTKIFPNIDLKHVVNIGDVCIINQESLRNPETSQETILKTLYHYKMISKVTLNSSFVNLELKKNQENLFPPQYFFQRLRSFGDRKMANIADHLQKINAQFQQIKYSCPQQEQTFFKDSEQLLLENFLQRMEGKKYFIYFSQISAKQTSVKNIVFSVPLLKALGCNLKNIAIDFLKYRHIFFQVFTAKNYANFTETALQNFAKIQSKLIEKADMTFQEKKELTQMRFWEQLVRHKQTDQGVFEELVRAQVVWYSPHPSICCFEIVDIHQDQTVLRLPRKIFNFNEIKPEEQLEALKNIGINNQIVQIEDDNQRLRQVKSQKTDTQNRNSRQLQQNIEQFPLKQQNNQMSLSGQMQRENGQQ